MCCVVWPLWAALVAAVHAVVVAGPAVGAAVPKGLDGESAAEPG